MIRRQENDFKPEERHDMSGYGIPTGPPQQIAMLLYPQMTALDLVGPQTILATMGNVKVHLVWKNRDVLGTDTGLLMQPTTTFAECPDNLTVLFVPGGATGTVALLDDRETLDFLAKRGTTAKYITSVCTGSLVLAAAGLLKGYRATTHWAVHDTLKAFGAIPVEQRVVEDRNRITGAGVTAGLDFALRLAGRLRNEKMGKALELSYEYDPQPPFKAGSVRRCPPDVVAMLRAMYAPIRKQFQAAAVKKTTAR